MLFKYITIDIGDYMKNILQFSKQLLLEHLTCESIVVDATLGNGNDTKFLCNHFKYVYAFDVQKKAIFESEKKLVGYDNYQLILDGHQNICKYVTKCNGAIFNLGYLPNSESNIVTTSNNTIKAVDCLLNIINSGIIVLVVYVGHDNGLEAKQVENYVSLLPSKFKVLKYQFLNRNNPPYIIAIKI